MANVDNQTFDTGDAEMQDIKSTLDSDDDDAPETGVLSGEEPDQEDDDSGEAEAQREAQHNIVADMARALLSMVLPRHAPASPRPPQGGQSTPERKKTNVIAFPRKSSLMRREEEQRLIAQMRARETIEERLERYRILIQNFEEDRENFLEKAGRWFFLCLAYIGPIIVAVAFGKEIGDAYGGPFSLSNGWSLGMHVGSYFGELALAMMSLTCATALRRMQSDKGYVGKLVFAALFLVLFSLASGLAQWFIALQHVDIHAAGGYPALIFRVAMPTAVDIASLIYISVMKFKSLKSHIENLRQEAIALRELNDADIAIRKSQNALKQQEAREDLLMKVEAIQAKAVLRAVEKSLLEQPEKRSGWQMRQSGN